MRFEHDKKQFAVKRRTFHNALSLLFFLSLCYLLWSKIVTIYLFCIMHPTKHNNCNNLVSCHKGNSVKPIKVISTIYSTYWKRATFYNRIGNDYGEYTKCTQELRQMIFGRFICFAYLHTGPKLCEHNCIKKRIKFFLDVSFLWCHYWIKIKDKVFEILLLKINWLKILEDILNLKLVTYELCINIW